jgi:hypothetical protein
VGNRQQTVAFATEKNIVDNNALWVLFAVAGLAIYQYAKSLSAEHKRHQATLDRVTTELDEIRVTLAALASDVERVAYTSEEREKKHFDRLPALTSESFVTLHAGDKLSLLLLTYTDLGAPLIYSVEYTHRELTYRSPNQKDAVAYGDARLDQSSEFKEARILFSRPNGTATLRGLSLEGHVKEGRGEGKPIPGRGATL